MNETINMGLSSEEKRRRQEREDAELLADHFTMHPDQLIPPEISREVGPEIAELEMMIALFEITHSLEMLHSIIDISPQQDAEIYNKRIIAKRDLVLIIEKLNSFRGNKRYEELKEKCKPLQKAVGSIANNKVNHK